MGFNSYSYTHVFKVREKKTNFMFKKEMKKKMKHNTVITFKKIFPQFCDKYRDYYFFFFIRRCTHFVENILWTYTCKKSNADANHVWKKREENTRIIRNWTRVVSADELIKTKRINWKKKQILKWKQVKSICKWENDNIQARSTWQTTHIHDENFVHFNNNNNKKFSSTLILYFRWL